MAIVKNGPAYSGKIGAIRFSQVDGVTIASECPTHIHDPKTPKQQKQRLKLNNILSTYRLLGDHLKENFEEVGGTRRACHVFRSINLMLPKHAWMPSSVDIRERVLAPMMVSSGTLPPVEYAYSDDMYCTNIEVGDLQLNDSTSVGQLARSIVTNNLEWEYGDKMQILIGIKSFFEPTMTDFSFLKQSNLGYIVFCIPMNQSCDDNLADLIRKQLNYNLQNPFRVKDGRLCFAPNLMESSGCQIYYAGAVVHSRKTKTGLRVSRQQLILSDTTVFDYFASDEILEKAMGMK